MNVLFVVKMLGGFKFVANLVVNVCVDLVGRAVAYLHLKRLTWKAARLETTVRRMNENEAARREAEADAQSRLRVQAQKGKAEAREAEKKPIDYQNRSDFEDP